MLDPVLAVRSHQQVRSDPVRYAALSSRCRSWPDYVLYRVSAGDHFSPAVSAEECVVVHVIFCSVS